MQHLPAPSRREFVAAAALTPALWTCSGLSLQDPTPVPANERITLGVIGAGGIRGRNLLRGSFLPKEGFQVVAVCDVDAARRGSAKELVDERYENEDCSTYVDYHELLARDDIDAVVIATPDHWHTIQIIDACKAGKDIYCEKPLTLTLTEGRTVIEAVRKHERVFQTGSQQRSEYGHKFVTACEHIRAGRIGRILNVNVGVGDAPKWCDLEAEEMQEGLDWDRWLGPAPMREYNSILSPRGVHNHYPAWRGYREYAGGYLADMGAHHFDIVQWALDADQSGPVRVVPPDDPEAMRGAALVYESGARLTHGGPGGATFIGTSGMIHVDRGRLYSAPEGLLEQEFEEGAERLPRHADHATNWLECIRDRTRPVCDVEVGARSVAICHLMNIAYWHRRELTWDPAAWRFVDDDEANGWLDYERREGYGLPSF